jgi:hypothetical protein
MSASNKRSYDSYAESACTVCTEAERKAAKASRLLTNCEGTMRTVVEEIPPQALRNFLIEIALKDVAIWTKLRVLHTRLNETDLSPSRPRQTLGTAGKSHPSATPIPVTTTIAAPTFEPPSPLYTAALGDMGPARHLLPIDQNVTHLPPTIPRPYTGPILDPEVITAKPLPKPRSAPKSSAQQPRAPLTFEHCCEAV